MEKLDCGHEPSPHGEHTTGYGTDAQGKTHCWDCCGRLDREAMKETGRATLYDCDTRVTNWPDTLSIPVMNRRKSRHNIAGWRYDLWFRMDGENWHGVRYGDNTQIVHCKRTKS